jgi:hypothetical protein
MLMFYMKTHKSGTRVGLIKNYIIFLLKFSLCGVTTCFLVPLCKRKT